MPQYDDRDFRLPSYRGESRGGLSAGVILLLVFLGLGLMGGGFVVLICFLVFLSNSPTSASKGSGKLQHTASEDRSEIVDAFHRRSQPQSSAEMNASVEKFFDDFEDRTQRGVQHALAETADTERMCDEFVNLGFVKSMSKQDRARFGAEFKSRADGKAADNTEPAWASFEIKKVQALKASPTEVIVYLRVRDELGITQKQRWWLRENGNGWRWFDFESLDAGIRFVALAGAAFQNVPMDTSRSMPDYLKMIAAARQSDWETVLKLSASLEKRNLLSVFRVQLLTFKGVALAMTGRGDEGVEVLNQAERMGPDVPNVHEAQALVYNRLGKFDQALAHAKKCIELLGDDADVYLQMGTALEALNRNQEAIDAFRKGLEDDPDDFENLMGMCRCLRTIGNLPPQFKRELATRMAKRTPPEDRIKEILSGFCNSPEDAEILEALLQGYTSKVPRSTEGDYYSIRLKILKSDIDSACEAFRKFIADIPAGAEQERYTSGFLFAMVTADKPLEGYRAAPDPRKAFLQVADDLVEGGSTKDLEALIDAHAAKVPDDTWLSYYRAEVQIAKKDDAAAEAELLKGLAQAKLSKVERQSYENSYVAVAFRLGNGLKAYDAAGDKKAAFGQLAWLFLDNKDAAGLQELVGVHRKTNAADGDLPLWDAQVKVLEKDYAGAADILKANRQKILQNKVNAWRFKDLLVRSLACEKKADEAIVELQLADEAQRNYVLEAVVYALAGNTAKTEAVLAAAVEGKHVSMLSFYNDPDLGPILRSEPFKKIAEKYPEPGRP